MGPVFLCVVLLAGCATTNAAGGAGRDDILTREQIMGVEGANSLHQVIQRLRPRWLIARAENRSLGGMSTGIMVYQDQTRLGGIDALRQIQPGLYYHIKYLDGSRASNTLPGLGSGVHIAGAIILYTRVPGKN